MTHQQTWTGAVTLDVVAKATLRTHALALAAVAFSVLAVVLATVALAVAR